MALRGANGKQFQGIKEKLENALLFGQDIYPATHEELLNMTNNYKDEVPKVIRTGGNR